MAVDAGHGSSEFHDLDKFGIRPSDSMRAEDVPAPDSWAQTQQYPQHRRGLADLAIYAACCGYHLRCPVP